MTRQVPVQPIQMQTVESKSYPSSTLLLLHQEHNGQWAVLIFSTNQSNAILRLDMTNVSLQTIIMPLLSIHTALAILCVHLYTFPGISTTRISNSLSPRIATALGHQDKMAQHFQSTKSPKTPTPHPCDTDLAPPLALLSNFIYLHISSESLLSYSDQTEKF